MEEKKGNEQVTARAPGTQSHWGSAERDCLHRQRGEGAGVLTPIACPSLGGDCCWGFNSLALEPVQTEHFSAARECSQRETDLVIALRELRLTHYLLR